MCDANVHTLDWNANEEAAKGPGQEIAKAVAKAESDLQNGTLFGNSGHLTAHQREKLPIPEIGSSTKSTV